MTLCPESYQKKVERRVVAGCSQRCEIRTVNLGSRKGMQNCRVYIPDLHEVFTAMKIIDVVIH
jgi:hypothetical protein